MKSKKKRNMNKVYERKLDKVFSLIIRSRGMCERCGKLKNLQCSHIHSRSKMSVRWDILNAFCLCAGCHLYWWHQHPIDAAEFTRKKLGLDDYDELNYRAENLKKWTLEEMKSLHSEFTKELNQ